MRSRALLWVPTAALLYLVVWPHVQRLLRGQELASLHVVSDPEGWTSFVTTDLWRNLPGPWIAALTFAVCGFAIVYFLGSRSFCTSACPYGAIFGAVDRLAPGRTVGTGDCKQCGRCTSVCQSHVRVREEIERFGAVVSSNCMKDLDCVSVCPNQALRFGTARPPLFRSWAALRGHKQPYDFSLPENALIAVTFLATLIVFRGLYEVVPFLLALGIAGILAYGAVLCLRLARDSRLRFNRLQLKTSGRLTGTGVVFAAAAVLLGGLVVHSAFIRYHGFLGQRAVGELTASAADQRASQAATATALSHLETVYEWGLLRPNSLRRRLASLYLLTNSPAAAEAQMRAVLRKEPDDREARLRLGKLLLRQGRTVAAAEELSVLASADGDDLRTRRDREIRAAAHGALAQIASRESRGDDAIRHLEQAVRDNPENAEALLALGAALADAGRLDESAAHLLKSAQLRPSSAAVHNNLGVVLTRLDRRAEALQHYRASLRIRPGDARVHYNLGMLLYKDGQLEAAEQALQAAVDMQPGHAHAHFGLALVLRDSGESDRSRQHHRRAAQLDSRYEVEATD